MKFSELRMTQMKTLSPYEFVGAIFLKWLNILLMSEALSHRSLCWSMQ